jgi:hypothetical protein
MCAGRLSRTKACDADFSKIHKYCHASQFHYFYGVSVAVDVMRADQARKSPAAQFLPRAGETPMSQKVPKCDIFWAFANGAFMWCAQGLANPMLATAEQI